LFIFAVETLETMCSYSITLDDAIVQKIRPTFASEKAWEQWLQQQLEAVILDYYVLMEKRSKARKAIEAMRRQSEQNGNSELTLEEINEEIRQARQERNKPQA